MIIISYASLVNGWSTDAPIKNLLTNVGYWSISRAMDGDELKQWREKNGYSQGRLARVLGVDVMTVSRWERSIMKIPSHLKWALAYLELKGEELKPPLKRKRK